MNPTQKQMEPFDLNPSNIKFRNYVECSFASRVPPVIVE